MYPSSTAHTIPRIAWLSLALMLCTPIAAQEPPAKKPAEGTFQLVINDANPTEELEAKTIARMFLKKLKRWDHNERVQPIDLEAKSTTRQAFTKAVHGKSVTAIQSFWQRMLFSGRDVPPEQQKSEKDVLDYVRANPGAIGYVAAETPLGDGVKKMQVKP